ncbi:hypothetical protein CFP65_6242 [Kitasatospora sp. MMS16-BH015]|uniref:DUF6230 family protein n=1 Tax=Kitasatospora sp. MMS16-BH015 TaxID=2018025 RepID=UPI000CA3508C|nr:DUF6230 family protein [Kitasatospora sp. MMS16-BH015]AUG80906.1 hypothetical protein CFP65_6242 [Kitasatospora sp. MMS16-BH015]
MTAVEAPEGRTHWRRALLVLLPALTVAGGLGGALAHGVLASGLLIQSGTIQLTTSSLYGTHYAAALVDQTVETATGTTAATHPLRMGFANGLLNGLCLAQQQQILGATYTLMITLGDTNPGSWEISTQNTVLDLRTATGTLDMDGLVDLNINGPDITTVTDPATNQPVPNPLLSPEHRFGIQAGYAKFDQVTATVDDLQLPGLLTTPNLSITVHPGTATCPAPQAPTGTPGTP